jgi:hypothetical protein
MSWEKDGVNFQYMDLVLKFGEIGGGHSLHILWNICNENVFFWYVMKYWKNGKLYIYNEI